jgi:hypothetical protein
MAMDSINQLKTWETGRNTERAKFARHLIEQLENPKELGTLSLLDLRREFEHRYDSLVPTKVRHFFRWLQPFILATYLLPVAYTWYELRNVLSSFASDRSLPAGTTLISYWTRGVGQFDGNTLQQVGSYLSIGIIIIFVLQLSADYLDRPPSEITSQLNDALYAVLFDVAQTRVLTPQEFTKTISAAASELESALSTITSTVDKASAMIEKVSTSTAGLSTASETLSTVSVDLREAVSPIVNLESTLRKSDDAIQNSTKSLSELHFLVTKTFSQIEDIRVQNSQVAQNSFDMASATEKLLQLIQDTNRSLNASGQEFSSALLASSEITSRLDHVLSAFDERDTQFLSVRAIANEISNATTNVLRAVEEIKNASNEFVRVNKDIAEALRDS